MKTSTDHERCNYSLSFRKERCPEHIAEFKNVDLKSVQRLSDLRAVFLPKYISQVERTHKRPISWSKVALVFKNEKLRKSVINGVELTNARIDKALKNGG